MDIWLILQVFSTFAMTGLIWLVQVVQYPLLGRVGQESFSAYHTGHMQRITFVVGPFMLCELFSAVMWLWTASVEQSVQAQAGILLLGAIWGSTTLIQVPLHETLQQDFTQKRHRELVLTNWIRTIAWTARSILLLWVLAGL
ncbi:MAG: hypothetical protein KDA78_04545 [Planctomycetaceae bacterium]|nr:hypothetical protein [Planctomycetaceae bacterium]